VKQQGEINHNARMDTFTAIRICTLLSSSDEPYAAIAKQAGATYHQVKNIAMGATWGHISADYDFRPRAVTVRRT
jgi:hypothetical protein